MRLHALLASLALIVCVPLHAAAPKPAAAKTTPAKTTPAKPAAKPKPAAPKPDTAPPWIAMSRATITISGSGPLRAAYYDYAAQSEREQQIEVAIDNPPGDPIHGTLMRVGDVLLSEGIPAPTAGHELDAFDAPAEALLLVQNLLQRSTDKKPGTLHETVAVTIVEKTDPIAVAGDIGKHSFGAPWTLHGSIDPDGADAVSFDLILDYNTNGAPVSNRLVGRWERSRDRPRFPDTQPFGGWQIYSLTPATKTTAAGATKIAKKYKNLGELRAAGKVTAPKPDAPAAKPAPAKHKH